jgi:hypothetical protein
VGCLLASRQTAIPRQKRPCIAPRGLECDIVRLSRHRPSTHPAPTFARSMGGLVEVRAGGDFRPSRFRAR